MFPVRVETSRASLLSGCFAALWKEMHRQNAGYEQHGPQEEINRGAELTLLLLEKRQARR